MFAIYWNPVRLLGAASSLVPASPNAWIVAGVKNEVRRWGVRGGKMAAGSQDPRGSALQVKRHPGCRSRVAREGSSGRTNPAAAVSVLRTTPRRIGPPVGKKRARLDYEMTICSTCDGSIV